MGISRTSFAAAFCAAVFFVPSPTDACIHAAGSGGEPVPVSQKGHQGLIVWHDGKQEMVLKIEYDSGAGDLAALGMVVPVPSVPEAFDTAAADLFGALDSWVHLERVRPQPRGGALRSRNGDHGAPRPALVALPAAAAGPYRIQPLQAFGDEGVTALTRWMEENDFAPIPPAVLSYYTERGWTFLTVKVDPAEGGALARQGGLPPLRVRFASDRAVYPLKLEAQGTFPLRLYLVTRDTMPDAALQGAVARGFEVAGARAMQALGSRGGSGGRLRSRVGRFDAASAPEGLRSILSDVGLGEGELTLRVLFSRRFGQGTADPSRWSEELSFPGAEEGARLMGTAVQPGGEEADEGEAEAEAEGGSEAETEGAAAEGESESEAESVAAAEEDDDDGACAAAGRPTGLPLFALLLGALLVRRRRRGAAR